jgi:hypothetical protein
VRVRDPYPARAEFPRARKEYGINEIGGTLGREEGPVEGCHVYSQPCMGREANLGTATPRYRASRMPFLHTANIPTDPAGADGSVVASKPDQISFRLLHHCGGDILRDVAGAADYKVEGFVTHLFSVLARR